MHIGLIGGIGPAATTHYYRMLTAAMDEVELTVAHASLRQLSGNVVAENREAQAEIFAKHVDGLKAAGADIAAVTSVAGHFCIDELNRRSSLPILSALDCLKSYFIDNGFERIGLLGNSLAMKSHLFGMMGPVSFVTPPGVLLDEVGEAYVQMARSGQCGEKERRLFLDAGRRMSEECEADAVLLGGTDLFLAFDGQETAYPVIDAARVHVEGIVKAASASS